MDLSKELIKIRAAAREYGVGESYLFAAARSGRLRIIRLGAGRNYITTRTWVESFLMSLATGGDINGGANDHR